MHRIRNSSLFSTDLSISEWTRHEKRQWFLILITGTAALYATRTSLPLLLPAITKECNWTKQESGTILSAFFWGYTLTQVIGGNLSDKIGGMRVIFIAAIGWSLITIFMPFSIRLVQHHAPPVDEDENNSNILGTVSMSFIVFIRILNGAFQGVHFPSMISITSQKLTEMERSSFFSTLLAGSAIGTFITGTLGSYLLELFGWAPVFYVLGSLALLWTLLLNYNILRSRNNAVIVGLNLNKSHSEKHYDSSRRFGIPTWGKLLLRVPFWACIVAHSCHNNCYFVMLSWMPTYFHEIFPNQKGWIVNMVPSLFMFPSTFIAKSVSERLIHKGYSTTKTRKIIQSLCFGIQITSLVGLAAAHGNFPMALLCSGLVFAATGFHNVSVAVNAQDMAPKNSGSAFGIVNTLGSIPGVLGVMLAGHLLHTLKSWPIVFTITAIIDLCGWICYVLFGTAEVLI